MKLSGITLSLLLVITLISCKKEGCTDPLATNYNEKAKKDDGSCIFSTDPAYVVPTTYVFTDGSGASTVNYSGQITRMTMLDSLSSYMSKGGTGTVLSATQLKNMYSNTGSPFGVAALDGSGKQLKDKTFIADQNYFDDLFDSLAVASQSAGGAASNGVAGVEGGRLFDKNGVELAQVIKKQLMGAIFYYQAMETYLANLPTDDNVTEVPGEGTAQAHHADEAFGYLGVPIDFPANTTNLHYWGGYCDEVNGAINSSTSLMNAFLKLRAAIVNKDNTTRDAQIQIVREQWERVVAASAILELTEAKEAFGIDNPKMRHVLSEALGFINGLKYNGTKIISNAQIDAALTALGTNFHTITMVQINQTIDEINVAYGFDLNAF